MIPTLRDQLAYACEHQEELRLLQQAVSTVPEGASVTASCMLVAPLSQREELYELKYHPTPDTDYLVLDLRPAYRSESLREARPFREAGYETGRLLGRRRGNSPGAVGSGFLTDPAPPLIRRRSLSLIPAGYRWGLFQPFSRPQPSDERYILFKYFIGNYIFLFVFYYIYLLFVIDLLGLFVAFYGAI